MVLIATRTGCIVSTFEFTNSPVHIVGVNAVNTLESFGRTFSTVRVSQMTKMDLGMITRSFIKNMIFLALKTLIKSNTNGTILNTTHTDIIRIIIKTFRTLR